MAFMKWGKWVTFYGKDLLVTGNLGPTELLLEYFGFFLLKAIAPNTSPQNLASQLRFVNVKTLTAICHNLLYQPCNGFEFIWRICPTFRGLEKKTCECRSSWITRKRNYWFWNDCLLWPLAFSNGTFTEQQLPQVFVHKAKKGCLN